MQLMWLCIGLCKKVQIFGYIGYLAACNKHARVIGQNLFLEIPPAIFPAILKRLATDRLWVYNLENGFVGCQFHPPLKCPQLRSKIPLIWGNMSKHTLENNQTNAINVTLHPLLLCKHFEGPCDNTQWRKVKLMQPMWLCFFWCR